MAYRDKIMTSIWGRRMGLQLLSSGQTGGRKMDMLVGPDAFREENTTSESTATNLKAWGWSQLRGSSAASSSVFTIDPPVPGVKKTVFFGSTGDIGVYLKSANSETFQSSVGTSFTVVKSTVCAVLELVGVTTAIWGAINVTSGTTSNASAFSLTTTT